MASVKAWLPSLLALVNFGFDFKVVQQICPLIKLGARPVPHERQRTLACAVSYRSFEMDASGDIRRIEGQKSFPNGLAATLRAIRQHIRTGENKRRTTKAFALEFGFHYDAVMSRYRPSDKTISNFAHFIDRVESNEIALPFHIVETYAHYAGFPAAILILFSLFVSSEARGDISVTHLADNIKSLMDHILDRQATENKLGGRIFTEWSRKPRMPASSDTQSKSSYTVQIDELLYWLEVFSRSRASDSAVGE